MALPSVDELLPEFYARIGVTNLSGTDKARAEACLSDASDLVTAAAGSGLADPPQPLAVTVTLNSARRAYLNPSGALQETVGPYSVRYGDESPNGVYLTSAELQALRTIGSHGLWTLTTYRESAEETLYVYDQDGVNGGDPIPFESRPLA